MDILQIITRLLDAFTIEEIAEHLGYEPDQFLLKIIQDGSISEEEFLEVFVDFVR